MNHFFEEYKLHILTTQLQITTYVLLSLSLGKKLSHLPDLSAKTRRSNLIESLDFSICLIVSKCHEFYNTRGISNTSYWLSPIPKALAYKKVKIKTKINVYCFCHISNTKDYS